MEKHQKNTSQQYIEGIDCLNCGNKLINKFKYHMKYCSYECQYNYNREKLLKNAKEKYISKRTFISKATQCKHCNTIFLSKTSNNIYCSKECCKQAYLNSNGYKQLLKLRFEIFKRDNFQCQYCGRTPKVDKCKLEIEHIIPRSKGGGNEINNLTTSCFECNQGKKDVLLEERQLNKEITKNE